MGTIHGASRYDLILQNKNIKPNYINITKKFGGQNSLSADEREQYSIGDLFIYDPLYPGMATSS